MKLLFVLASYFLCVNNQVVVLNETVTAKPVSANYTKPNRDVWPSKYNNRQNNILGDWLLKGCWSLDVNVPCDTVTEPNVVEYEGYDGFFNNIAKPDLGAIDKPLIRRWPAAYEDGTYRPSGSKRPNPFELSDKLLRGETGTRSKTGKNALLVFFGQQVVEEILDAQRPACPPEYFNIPIPENHTFRTMYGHTEMPFLRTRTDQKTGYNPNNPRQQLNEITPYLDGGLIYGTTKQWADELRTYKNGTVDPNGRLASSHDGLFPEYNTNRLPMANPPSPFYHATYIKNHETDKVDRFFKLGNPRGNENTFLLTFGILWFRWHNYLADCIRKDHNDWTSEKVFNEARKWVIATYQHVVFNEWLPTWVNTTTLPPYSGYDPNVDPQIDQFFQAAAFRFGHTLVVPGVYLRDYTRNNCTHFFEAWGKNAIRTCNVFWRPQEVILKEISSGEFIDVDRVLMGMSVQLCEEEDHKIVEDLRQNVFGPLEFPRRDLMAINIQRGRDHGLPDYNTARRAYGLSPVGFDHFANFIKDQTVMDNLMKLYNYKTDDIDPWVGGILETGDGPGELFEAVIIDQFRRIRDGDRFWFENLNNGLFNENEIRRIKLLSLYDVIQAVTKMDENDIPRFPFRVPVESDRDLIKYCNLMQSTCKETNGNNNCYHLPILNSKTLNETCTQGVSYDYFNNSEASFILTFTFLSGFLTGTVCLVYYLINHKKKETSKLHQQKENKLIQSLKIDKNDSITIVPVNEWIGPKQQLRPVVLNLLSNKKQILVTTQKGSLLRVIDLSLNYLHVYKIIDHPYLILKSMQNYDLVIKFDTEYLREMFLPKLEKFIDSANIEGRYVADFTLTTALKSVVSKTDRQKRLEMFFRVLFAQAFNIEHTNEELLSDDTNLTSEIFKTELTLHEFADALNMQPNSDFVKRMFDLADKDKNNFVSFREFADLLIIFAKGDEEEKAHLLFKLYDVNNLNYLTRQDFIQMIRSFLETVGGDIEPKTLNQTVEDMMKSKNLFKKTELTFEDFRLLLGRDILKLGKAKLDISRAPGNSYVDRARNTIQSIYGTPDEIQSRFQGDTNNVVLNEIGNVIDNSSIKKNNKFVTIIKYVEKKSRQIFWVVLYTLILWAIFAERAYYYSIEREHSGLRRIAGYGVTVTRGAASAMMFTYSSLLLTMCRNTITYLRDTFLNKYIPFDSLVEFHKYIAYWALAFTMMHVIGHAFNFYHISTQTADDLTCLFRNFFHSTHELPKFHYWCWQTITGFTGIILTVITITMYVFAQSNVRRKIYNWFWYTHNLYPLFFIFMVLHGIGRLIQEPYFYYFFLAPVVIFAIDKTITTMRKKIEIPVIQAEILPSNVTMLEFKKPENFEYKSGQWVRIACLDLNKNEFHPFTLTSSPDEENLTVHIRAVGPWTMNIRQLYDNTIISDHLLPKIYLDGPYGEGHQDWNRYEVSILVGGGIGVTPFASILKNIVHTKQLKCKKVYFIWVSKSQKQFEWLIDILRSVEEHDKEHTVSSHIFITQFYEKFDIRTVLLYIFERYYQRISDNKSLFTNLKAITHFGRPSFAKFFKTVQCLYPRVRTVGVFSCGPTSMTNSIEKACYQINKNTTGEDATFEHHYNNF